MKKMSHLKQYEDAIVKYNKDLRINALPVLSSDFHYQFVKELKQSISDSRNLKDIALKNKWEQCSEWDIDKLIEDEVIVVTDAKLTIVFASQNMKKMNGYLPKEVLGRSPKMFQGEGTNSIVSSEIRAAIKLQESLKTVLNYKKNGEIYSCLIKGYPVFNKKGQLTHYIAFEKAA
jgi:PAS domain S-box-containing protein